MNALSVEPGGKSLLTGLITDRRPVFEKWRVRRALSMNAVHERSNELDLEIEVHQCKCHLGSNREPTRSWVNIRSRSQFKKLNKS